MTEKKRSKTRDAERKEPERDESDQVAARRKMGNLRGRNKKEPKA